MSVRNVHAVLLRQLLSTTESGLGKAKLLWVPTRRQLANGLTKANRGGDRGMLFHERALRRGKPPVQLAGQKGIDASVDETRVA